MKTIRIGSGAGYSGDRIEPAVEVMEHGDVDYLIFECLAERTIALAQQRRSRHPEQGYNELLAYRMRHVLPLCARKRIKVITNMGAANPRAAVEVVKELATSLGLTSLKVAAVLGDDLFPQIARYHSFPILETGQPLKTVQSSLVSANAYLGAQGIVQALQAGTDVVITGRVADPALVLAPLLFEFGWDMSQYDLLGKGTLAGHLLECGAQVTGGYFADPGYKDVPDLAHLGFPIIEVTELGEVTVTKVVEAGGMVTSATVKEQLLYEIHDPSQYFTPDVTADFSQVTVTEVAPNQIQVSGARGHAPNGQYKTSVGYRDGFLVEAEISYGGTSAYRRARLAGQIITLRLADVHVPVKALRVEYIGVNSLYHDVLSQHIVQERQEPLEVRLRVAARTATRAEAERVGNEVEALYTNGPAGGGGVRVHISEELAIASILIPASDVQLELVYEEI
ncbi:ABC transporter substrate-binding protein [Dictyobacter sp. S3.2.2.5]|uniref:ABC transporter substrate-binding protein n=1 Tax=Dictyobacter halimunensis TaxID=3026934 RepID=A0ABQ6FI49_9CHLR|nr:ABC transporter substrate-binding protein [Dictyobacter sp. S3.2.2.5]